MEACVRALREVCENNSVYTLEALRKLLATKGYNFNNDIIFHAMKRLQEEEVFREIDQNTYWFKKDGGDLSQFNSLSLLTFFRLHQGRDPLVPS